MITAGAGLRGEGDLEGVIQEGRRERADCLGCSNACLSSPSNGVSCRAITTALGSVTLCNSPALAVKSLRPVGKMCAGSGGVAGSLSGLVLPEWSYIDVSSSSLELAKSHTEIVPFNLMIGDSS